MKEIGHITHYFDKIGVAIVELKDTLRVGDVIQIENKVEYEQEIYSMQLDHKDVEEGKAGDKVGIKVDQPVRKGEKVILK